MVVQFKLANARAYWGLCDLSQTCLIYLYGNWVTEKIISALGSII